MSAAENERGGGLFHTGDQLGNSKSRFNVAAHRVQNYQKPADIVTFLDLNDLRDQTLVFCRFLVGGQDAVPLDLTADRDGLDALSPAFGQDVAVVL